MVGESSMARARAPRFDRNDDPRLQKTLEDDNRRDIMLMPPDAMRRDIRKLNPVLSDEEIEDVMRASMRMRENDPLAVLQEGSLEGGKGGGQINMFKLAPNFEMTMYVAQATGACIVTDSPFRWKEVRAAAQRQFKTATPGLASLVADIERSKFAFPQDVTDIVATTLNKTGDGYPEIIRDLFKYLSTIEDRGTKPNYEAHLVSRFASTHSSTQRNLQKSGVIVKHGRISCVMPPGGIKDNTINRLLLMSSSEKHLLGLPAAYFIEPANDLLAVAR